jgi:2-methylcitrate dehydratase PrpD
MSEKGITAQLAAFVEESRISQMPDSLVQKAKQLITDFLGVTVGGSVEHPSRIIQAFIQEQGSNGEATIVGTPIRAHSTWAALANGIAGHALDFDDASQPMYGHPTVAVLPAALAIGEILDITGAALLESYIIGVEVAVKLSYGMNPSHYKTGWHSTCTLGSIGSSMAAAKLLGLTGDKLHHTLALAASQAGGLQQNFGTMTKPFHAGRAAQNGVLAALLAQRGWTGDQNILESPLGFFRVFSGATNGEGERVVGNIGKPFDIEQPGIILKKYPSCAFSHPAIDAALIVAADPHYDLAQVERIEGQIHSLADQILIHRNPRTGLEAKFSLEGCIATALLEKEVSRRSFSDEWIGSQEMKDMIAKVERKVVSVLQEKNVGFGPATVRVFLKGGRVLEASVEKARGNPENPMDSEEIQGKYMDCCSGVLSNDMMEKSFSLLQGLERLNCIRDLLACFRVG